MKLIDEKGRLFGKINLIDLLVVLLIVAVLAAVVWKLGGSRAAAAVAGTEKKAVYTVEFEDVSADIAEYAKTHRAVRQRTWPRAPVYHRRGKRIVYRQRLQGRAAGGPRRL